MEFDSTKNALVSQPDVVYVKNGVISDLIAQWNSAEYSELSCCLAALKAAYSIHQGNHWCVSKSYGDHLMFGRAYEELPAQIDYFAEKIVALAGTDLIDNVRITATQLQIESKICQKAASSTEERVLQSIEIENFILDAAEEAMEILSSKMRLTKGLENMIQGLMDSHENIIYILSQRIK